MKELPDFGEIFSFSLNIYRQPRFWVFVVLIALVSMIVVHMVIIEISSLIFEYLESDGEPVERIVKVIIYLGLILGFGPSLSFIISNIFMALFAEDPLIKDFSRKFYGKNPRQGEGILFSLFLLLKYKSIEWFFRILLFPLYFFPILGTAYDSLIMTLFTGKQFMLTSGGYVTKQKNVRYVIRANRYYVFRNILVWFAVLNIINFTVIVLLASTIILIFPAIFLAVLSGILENFMLLSFTFVLSRVIVKSEREKYEERKREGQSNVAPPPVVAAGDDPLKALPGSSE